MKSLGCLLLLLLCATYGFGTPEITAVRSETELLVDGVPDESAWEEAHWVLLDSSRPKKPQTQKQMKQLSCLLGHYLSNQFAQKVHGAVLWTERGLC